MSISGRAGFARKQARIDSFRLERGRPTLVRRSIEQDVRVSLGGEPAVTSHFLVELTLAPASIAESRDPTRRSLSFGNGFQDVDRAGHRENLALRPGDVERVLAAPIGRMEHKPPPGLDRSSVMYCTIGGLVRVDLELLQQSAKVDPGALMADADADRPVLIVDAHRNDRALEARVRHAGHRQEKLSGQEGRLAGHHATMRRRSAAGKS